MNRRPEWAANAFIKWHKASCDHRFPANCGYEGQLWFQQGTGWGRRSVTGKAVVFFENGDIELQEDFI